MNTSRAVAALLFAAVVASCGARSTLIVGATPSDPSAPACLDGTATLVARSQAVVIRANPRHVVYATSSPGAKLLRIAPDGSGARELHAFSESSNQGAWALRGDVVVLNDGGRRLVHIDVRTGATRVLYAPSAPIAGWWFALDDGFVYWGERDNRAQVERVQRVSLTGGAAQQLAELRFTWQYADYSANRNVEIAVVDGSVYWLHEPTIPRGGGSNRDGVVYRMAVTGGAPTPWISNLETPRRLATSADAVWVLEEGSSSGWAVDDRLRGRGFDGSDRDPIAFSTGARDYSPSEVIVANDDVLYVLGGTSDGAMRSGWWRKPLRGGVAALVAQAPIGRSPILSAAFEPTCDTLLVCQSIVTVESDLVRYSVGR